jgi:hypothetical protein
MATKGRNGDSMLVHMTPGEVAGLHALALKHGGSLTVNPDTGLPEANFLKSLLPMLAGAALNFFVPGLGAAVGGAFGVGAAAGTGIAVGGITGLATGSLSRGLMAGLGAYGGAGMVEGIAGLGAGELAQGQISANMPTLAEGATQTQIADYTKQVNDLRTAGLQGANQLPMADKFSAGFESAKANPLQFAKNNMMALGAAATPIMADMMTPTTTKMPELGNTGYIRQKIYDPYTQTYTSMAPVKASEFGSRQFSDIYRGYKEGGIVALANGGAPGYANGALVNDKQIFDYFATPGAKTDAQIAADMQTFNVTAADIARATGTQNLQGDYEKRFVQAVATPAVTAPTFLAQTADVGLQNQQLASALGSSGLSGAAQYALTHSDVGTGGGLAGLSANINTALADPSLTRDAAQTAMTKYNITDADVQRATGQTSGDIFAARDAAAKAAADKAAADAAAKAAADKAAADKAAADKAAADKAAADKAAADKAIADAAAAKAAADAAAAAKAAADKAAADALAKALADGKTATEAAAAAERARREIEAAAKAAADKAAADAAAAANKITVDGTYVGTSGPAAVVGTKVGQGTITGVGSETTTGTTGPIINFGGTAGFTTSPLTLAQKQIAEQSAATTAAQNTQLDLYRSWITQNPNATDADHANFMDKINLSPDVASRATPLSSQQMKNRYYDAKYNKMTGDSQAAYNFLMGKGAYPTKSGAGQIMRPYSEATLGMPGSTNQKYIFDPETRSYKLNQDYVGTTRDAKGDVNYTMSPAEIASYFKANQGQADSTTYDWAVENNLTPEEIASATGVPLSTVAAKWRDAKAKKAAATKTTADAAAAAGKTETQQESTGLAAGGIAGFAMGGMPMYAVGGGLGSLGSYSDGGRLLKGPGDGVSDSIPATIGRKQQPARLADGEFVVPARIVSELGNGSTEAGAKKLYAMMDRVQRARGKTTGKNKVAANSRADKYLPA